VSPAATERLYGREGERSALLDLLDAARESRSGALVLRGEAGVGKSALLSDAAAAATDFRVIRTAGVEAEFELAFAAVHQLTRPLLDHLDEIPEPQAGALRGALGETTQTTDDRFLIAAALLSLFAAAAEESPLLCAVDDAHWLDRPSADALTFVARRLEAEPIALVFAARGSEERSFDAAGVPDLELEGIDAGAAGALLSELGGGDVTPDVRDRLVSATGGNPLALLELHGSLDSGRLSGAGPLPLSSRLETEFLERAGGLSEPSQKLLLLAAADDTGDPEILMRGSDALGIDIAALEEAEAQGFLRVAEAVEFRHPLVRSAVYQGASFAQRQAVHLALVEALDGEQYRDRRAWHRASATLGTDAEIAEELERSADRARRRSGHGAAADALERAAALTPDDEVRGRRLAAAANEAWLGGQAGRAISIIDAARELVDDPTVRADLAHLRGRIELQIGVAPDAHAMLLAAGREAAASDPRKAVELFHSAMEAAALAGLFEGQVEVGRQVRMLAEGLEDDVFEVPLLIGVAEVCAGEVDQGAPRLRRAIELGSKSGNTRQLIGAAAASSYIGDMAGARGLWSRAVAEAREQGAITVLAHALSMEAAAELWNGRVASARANATEGLALARETGQEGAACALLAVLSRAAAFYGQEEECRERAKAAIELAVAHGVGMAAGTATWALGELELSLGSPTEALARLEIVATGSTGLSHRGLRFVVTPDLVEAAVRADRPEVGAAALGEYEAWAAGTDAVLAAPLVFRCRALLAESNEAAEHYEQALRLHAEAEHPYDLARTELLYGGALRRGRERKQARRHLRAALETFEQLGASGWAERARTELRASGETARRRDPSTLDQLTPQELQIARFVAEGATNKEVAAQLFLSPRTIDFHLRNVFSKLGIKRRGELGRYDLGQPGDFAVASPR
jgi:DNA-binding CsgD family transcriptional regulator